jgi:UDP-N-acetylmuramate--alanine ligase
MKLAPAVAVVTNIDPEHLDHYGSLDALRRTFVDFINKVPFYGLGVLCIDHPMVQGLLPQIDKRYVTYGLAPLATYRATDLEFSGLASSFTAVVRGEERGRVVLPMPGRHNVLNSLAVLAVADFLGVAFDVYREALTSFQGVGRRFTVRGETSGVMIVDDYGHHPAEVRATLEGARAGFHDRRLIVAFQPHRYTRTRDLMAEFACAFNEADRVYVCDVYAAGEEPIEGASSERLVKEMRASGHPRATHVARRADLAAAILPELRAGDIVITLGAGDVWQVGEEIMTRLGAAA